MHESTDLIGLLLMEYVQVLGGEDERKNLITAHLEVFRDSFQAEHHAASESRSCCIKVDSGPVYTETFSLENTNFCLRVHLSFT